MNLNLNKMKVLTDKQILELIQSHGIGKDLKLASDEYSHFDAIGEHAILEFKLRMDENEWPSYYIEGLKCMNNFRFAEKTGRSFWLVYVTKGRIILWNMSVILKMDGISFHAKLLPSETSNPDSKKIIKCVNLMPVNKAFKIIDR